MTQVFAVNAQNDLYIGADGALARATGEPAVMQAAQQAAQTVLGEMVYATDQGVPYLSAAGSPNVAQFEASLRRALIRVDGVLAVPELRAQLSAGVLSYRAVIRTAYGLAALNG